MRNAIPLLILLTTWMPAPAGAGTLELAPAECRISFTLGATLHTVEGTAELDRGKVHFNPETGELSGEIVVDAASTDTDNRKRDKKMHSEVLHSEQHPQIVFRPASFSGDLPTDGTAEIVVSGTMTLHGTDHRVEWPVTVARTREDLEIRASFEVPYVKWGLEDPSTFILRVEKHVDVTVEASGSLVEPTAADQKAASDSQAPGSG